MKISNLQNPIRNSLNSPFTVLTVGEFNECLMDLGVYKMKMFHTNPQLHVNNRIHKKK